MEDWQLELKSKTPDLSGLANWMDANPDQIPLLVQTLSSSDDTLRFNAFSLVMEICRTSPGLIYPFWDQLEKLLRSENNFQRSIAIRILAALCKIDQDQKFETVRETYFGLLNCGSVMTARYIIQSASEIYLAKPALRNFLKTRFLEIDAVSALIPERIELLKTDVLLFFDFVYEYLQHPDHALDFARQALTSTSPKTRKQAKAFLAKHSG